MASLTGDRGLWFHLRDQNSFTTNLEFSQSLSIRSNTFNIYTNIVDEGNGGGGLSSRFMTNTFYRLHTAHMKYILLITLHTSQETQKY